MNKIWLIMASLRKKKKNTLVAREFSSQYMFQEEILLPQEKNSLMLNLLWQADSFLRKRSNFNTNL